VKPLALRTSLTLVYTGMLAFLVSALAVGFHRALVRQLDTESTTALGEMTRGLHGYLRFTNGSPSLEYSTADPEAVTFIEDATRYYQVYDARDGLLLVQSPALESLGLRYTPGEIQTFLQNPGVEDLQTDRGRLRMQSSLIRTLPGETYLLQVGEPLDRLDRAIATFDRLLFWWLGAGLLVAAMVGHWMAGRALAPLSRLARTMRTIDITNLRQRVAVRGAEDELDEVAHSFNLALERVERAVGEMRQFSAALAHELRTPLAVLRGETELALTQALPPEKLREKLAIQLDEFDRLTRLVNQILTLARAEAGEIALAKDPVDLAALSASIADQLETVAGAQGVGLTCETSGSVVVTGDAGWLERLLLLLLDNAIKFTPAGGHITMRLSGANGTARLDVSDTGPGIPPESLSRIFEPFYRGDPARSRHTEGAGLGLALGRWIVDHHGGTVGVTSRLSEGSTFTVRLPLQGSTVKQN
jgi:heavy metal sensor kinase